MKHESENSRPTDECVAELVLEILCENLCHGEASALTNEKILVVIRRMDGFLAVDEQQLRRAYAEHLGVCTSARGIFLPVSESDRTVFKRYLETKIRTQAIHAARRLKRLDEAFPQFAADRGEPIQFELDLDRIGE